MVLKMRQLLNLPGFIYVPEHLQRSAANFKQWPRTKQAMEGDFGSWIGCEEKVLEACMLGFYICYLASLEH